MTVQTRFYRGGTHTVNGLTASPMALTQGTATVSAITTSRIFDPIARSDVYTRTAAGVQTIRGTNVAPISIHTAVNGATWTAPAITLAATDALVFEETVVDGAWGGNYGTFITDQLNQSSIVAATWTFFRSYTIVQHYDTDDIIFNFNSPVHNSRVTGITFGGGTGQQFTQTINTALRSTAGIGRSVNKRVVTTLRNAVSIRRSASKLLAGTVRAIPSINRHASKTVSTSIQSVSIITRHTTKTISAPLRAIASVIATIQQGAQHYIVVIDATLRSQSRITLNTAKQVVSAVFLTTNGWREIVKQLASTNHVSSIVIRHTSKSINTGIALTANLGKNITKHLAITGHIHSTVIRHTAKSITASVTFTSLIWRGISKQLASTNSMVVAVTRHATKNIGVGIAATSSMTKGLTKTISTALHTVTAMVLRFFPFTERPKVELPTRAVIEPTTTRAVIE